LKILKVKHERETSLRVDGEVFDANNEITECCVVEFVMILDPGALKHLKSVPWKTWA